MSSSQTLPEILAPFSRYMQLPESERQAYLLTHYDEMLEACAALDLWKDECFNSMPKSKIVECWIATMLPSIQKLAMWMVENE